MRIAFIAAGAAGAYCGSCLRDNALASALLELGEEVILIPAYTPLRVDEPTISGRRVVLNALEVYSQQKLAWLRGPRGIVRRIIGGQKLREWVTRVGLGTSPAALGSLTTSMLRGEEGNQRRLVEEMVDWLATEIRPDVVHLPNSLLSGLAREIRRKLQVPVVLSLQGEALFLEGLPEPHRGEALRLIRERCADVDRLTASSAYEADHLAGWIGLDRSQIDVVLPGIRVQDFGPAGTDSRPPTIGYFARIAPEKGFHVLAEAFLLLRESGEFPGIRLRAAGFLGARERRYAALVRRRVAARRAGDDVEILGTLERADKLKFLREVDVLSVPTTFPEPKGIFLLEAWASGLAVVQPNHGSFPELLEATGAGLLHEPGNAEDLALKLAELLRDPVRRVELGQRGRASVEARFTSRRMAEDVLAIYRKLRPLRVS